MEGMNSKGGKWNDMNIITDRGPERESVCVRQNREGGRYRLHCKKYGVNLLLVKYLYNIIGHKLTNNLMIYCICLRFQLLGF